jgi:hypothetical protein
MRLTQSRGATALVPIVASAAMLLAACGGNGSAQVVGQAAVQAPAVAAPGSSAAQDASVASVPEVSATQDSKAPAAAKPAQAEAPAVKAAPVTGAVPGADVAGSSAGTAAARANAGSTATAGKTAKTKAGATQKAPAKAATSAATAEAARNQAIYDQLGGATEQGVTKTQIKLGTVSMHAVPLNNLFIGPMVRGNLASATAINDRGGILGRRLSIVDCDDGVGDVSRTKACIKKLAGQDKIFALMTSITWGTASIHEDLKQQKLPNLGAWAYSQTEWQDPYMFPTHMSMIHEAIAGANWVRDNVKPKTYGLICLTSPEMQIACDQVEKVLTAAGIKLVKQVDVGVTEPSMSPQILAMRGANPDHIIHYVINPATMSKFMIEARQQDYYPPLGISGNHLASEVLGSIFGKHPENRYWTNTTYKLWGADFIATMTKYAKGNAGMSHHIVQAGYVAMDILSQAAKRVGPNLTRERLMSELANGTVWRSDASLDQKFSYAPSERFGDNWAKDLGQGREFMYKYTSQNTTANPNGSPNGFEPDDRQFVIYTNK